MPSVFYEQPSGSTREIVVDDGDRVMQAALEAGVEGIVADCGGQAMCATCHVYVAPSWLQHLPPIEQDEEEMLNETASPRTEQSRLSCQLVVTAELDGLSVQVAPEQLW